MLILINKPTSWTSHDAITYVKRQLWLKKIWHSGTLDPNASWLLVCGGDEDTKTLSNYVWLDKSYTTTIDLSVVSDTWDKDPRDLLTQYDYDNLWLHKDNQKVFWPNIDDIVSYMDWLIWVVPLPLPPFSAKKVWGKKWYELARKGQQEIRYSDMTINSYRLLSYEPPFITLSVDVWSGTYIRSIAYDMWIKFGTWWVLHILERTRVWEFYLQDISKVEWSKIDYKVIDG